MLSKVFGLPAVPVHTPLVVYPFDMLTKTASYIPEPHIHYVAYIAYKPYNMDGGFIDKSHALAKSKYNIMKSTR